MKKLIVGAVITVFLIGVAYVATAEHWWMRVFSARVTYNGHYSPGDYVYRSREGNLLIDLRAEGENLYQVHYFSERKLWLVGNTWNFYFLPGFAFSRTVPPPCVDMGGPKIETDPKLIVRDNYLEFTSSELAHVQVEC